MRVDSLKHFLVRLDEIERAVKGSQFASVVNELNSLMIKLREEDFSNAISEEKDLLVEINQRISRLMVLFKKEQSNINKEQASKMKEQSQLQAYYRQA